jgi:carotenoid cleavage dioxygenase-like enzyme
MSDGGGVADRGTDRGGATHPLAAHALLDRRAFVVRAAAIAAAGGPLAAFLSACSTNAGTSSTGAGPGTSIGLATAGTSTTAVPPLPYDPAQPYWMQGGFAPVKVETESTTLSVTGSLPKELNGLYVRNGSNPASGPSPHWFLGDGMVHGVRLQDGKALSYRNRYLDTPMYRNKGDFLSGGAPGGEGNQSNVSVFHHAGKLLSSGEVGWPYELSTDDLHTIGPYNFGGKLHTAMTAHPKIDPATGKMHFFGYGFVPPYLTYHVADAAGQLEYSAEVTVAGPTMIHDFAVTDTDAIFWELPVVFDLEAAVKALQPGNAGTFPFKWQESYGARIGIMPLGGPTSAIRWVEIPPCYVFHGVNAYREGTKVVLEVCRIPSMFKDGADLDKTASVSAIHRWTIETAGPELVWSDEIISDVQMDLPSIDRRHTGRAHANAWFLTVDDSGPSELDFGGLCRRAHDGTLDRWDAGPALRPNEGFFVPSGPADGEGWILTYVWDRARDASDLAVFDALEMAKGPIARVHLPVRVPYGFHAVWVPDA